MPHLTLQILPEGPIIDVIIGVSKPREEILKANNLRVPSTRVIRAVIDTGACCTCIDSKILTGLELSPTGNVPIHTPSTLGTPHLCNQYDISLIFLHSSGITMTFPIVPIIESDLTSQGIQALIGRDLLARCLFVYDGQSKIFSLAF